MEKKMFYVTRKNYENTLGKVFSEICPSQSKREDIHKKSFQINSLVGNNIHGYKRQSAANPCCILKYRLSDYIYTEVVKVCVVTHDNGFLNIEVQNCFKEQTPNHAIVYFIKNTHNTGGHSKAWTENNNVLLSVNLYAGGTGHPCEHNIMFAKKGNKVNLFSSYCSMRGAITNDSNIEVEEGLYSSNYKGGIKEL